MPENKEVDLQLVDVEPPKSNDDKLKELEETLNRCELIIDKIKTRKSKKTKIAI